MHPPLPPGTFQSILADVHRHPQQPAAQMLRPIEGLFLHIQPQKHLLHRVLRVLWDAEPVQGHTVYHIL